MPSALYPASLRITEIAALLGVTRQRASEMAEDERFPKPFTTEGRSRLWRRDDVEAWIDQVDWWGSWPWRRPSSAAV